MKELKPTEAGNDLTRRQWLLVLGEIATVAGFSGLVPEIAAVLSGNEEQRLPPGLYYPSHDHLFHVLSSGAVRTIPPGTETEYATSSIFRPQFFSHEESEIVTRIMHILLGQVDGNALAQAVQWLDLYLHSAPGVRDAALQLDPLYRTLAVAYYGEAAVREMETVEPEQIVRSGLKALQNHCHEQHSRDFLLLDEGQQRDIVSTITYSAPSSPLERFFGVVRVEAIRGYYTTAAGLKELDYKGNWYYGSCPGCKPNS